MNPPVPIGLPRKTPPEGAVVVGKWLPGGATIAITQYAALHTTTNFNDLDTLVPERWIPVTKEHEVYGADKKTAFNPFYVGPRSCLRKK